MPPKNSGKFVINKKYNEGTMLTCYLPNDLPSIFLSGGGGSVNTGKYKGENWGDDDESQQDIRYTGCFCLFHRLCLTCIYETITSLKIFFRIKECRENDLIDSKYGFDRLTMGEKTAYLINMHACEVDTLFFFMLNRLRELQPQVLDEDRRLLGAVDYYFIEEDGARCKLAIT